MQAIIHRVQFEHGELYVLKMYCVKYIGEFPLSAVFRTNVYPAC